MGLKVRNATLEVELVAGRVNPLLMLNEVGEVWDWMACGQLEAMPCHESGSLEEMRDQMLRLWQNMQDIWIRDYGLHDAEARDQLAQMCGYGHRQEELGGREDWARVVAAAALKALQEGSPGPGEPRRYEQVDVLRLWLLACREAGVPFFSPQEQLVKMLYFVPAWRGGWMDRPSWFGVRGSVNKPFGELVRRQPAEVACLSYWSEVVQEQVVTFGLTREGAQSFRDQLQQAGIPASALDRLGTALRGAHVLPASYPAELLEDPDDVLQREEPR